MTIGRPTIPTGHHRSFPLRLAALAVAVNVFACALAGMALYTSHQNHRRAAEVTSQNLAQVLEHNISATIERIDDALSVIAEEMARQERSGRPDEAALHATMTYQLTRTAGIVGLRTANAQGQVTRVLGGGALLSHVTDRDYYLRLRDDPAAGLVISPPVFGRISNQWIVVLARRLDKADGSFAGIVFAPVPLDRLIRSFAMLDLGSKGAVSLRDSAGAVIARYPDTLADGQTAIGRREVSPGLRDALNNTPQGATFPTVAALDGVRRIVSYRKVTDYPLFIALGLAEEDYLADWRTELARTILLLGLFAVLSAISAHWVLRNWRAKEAALERASLASARLGAVLGSAPIGLAIVDEDRHVLEANQALADIFGVPPNTLKGNQTRVLYSNSDDFHALGERAYPLIWAGETFADTIAMQRHDGTTLWCRLVGRKVDADAPELGVVWVFEDITEQLRGEEEIRRLASYQKAILDNTPLGIAILSAERVIIQANDAFCAIYGRQGEQLAGQPASILYADAAQSEDVRSRAQPVVMGGGTFCDDVLMCRSDGTRVWVRQVARLVDVNQPELGVVWAAQDVSTLKELNESLLRSNAELERFAYVASHDMRQPLRMISSYIGLIQRRLGDNADEELREFLGYAVDGAQRMDRMIVDLLDYSRLGRQSSPRQEVALADPLDRALNSLAAAIAETGAQVSVPEHLPTLVGSASELERLFLNLIGNALKFRAPDRAPHVTVECGKGDGEWVISVADNGIGIDPAQHDRLFTLFSRLVAAHQYEGTGIGLAACRKIAEHHGGRIWVESPPGGGTIFRVALPRQRG